MVLLVSGMVFPQKGKGKKPEIPPWEAALMSSATKSKDQKRIEAARRQAEAEEARKVI